VIAVGLAMLALEFTWAERVLERTLARMTETSSRVRRLGRLEKAVSVLAGVAAVGALIAVAMYFEIPFLPV
jgi:flagellar biosynthesis/type III secretory pathway M-ring protein FliF/YscJ